MKNLQRFGLAVIAVTALMGFSAGTASATKLCTDSACTTVYAAGTEVKAELVAGTSTRLTSGGSTIGTCTSSSVSSKTGNKEGATVSGTISSGSAGGCSQTTHGVALGSLEVAWTSGSNGTVTSKSSQVTVQIFGVSCTYGTGEGTHLGSITGGSAPILKIATTVTKTAGGFLCPGTAGWDAEYVLTSPHALFVGN
jgi:hypothetical protein